MLRVHVSINPLSHRAACAKQTVSMTRSAPSISPLTTPPCLKEGGKDLQLQCIQVFFYLIFICRNFSVREHSHGG